MKTEYPHEVVDGNFIYECLSNRDKKFKDIKLQVMPFCSYRKIPIVIKAKPHPQTMMGTLYEIINQSYNRMLKEGISVANSELVIEFRPKSNEGKKPVKE